MIFKKILFSNFFVLLILTGLVLLVFGKSITFQYVGLDEESIIDDRITYLRDLSNIPETFLHNFNYPASKNFNFYRPVFTISLMTSAVIGENEAWIYNLTNLIIHILASFSLYLLFIKLKTRKEIAFFLALLFSVHPLVTATISWIPGRNDSLLGLFSILTFLFFIYFLEKKKKIYLIIHILFFSLALFTKENAVALIPICYYFYFISKDKKDPFLLKLPIILWGTVTAIWFALRYFALSEINAAGIPIESFFRNFPGLLIYIYKLVIPFQMTVMPTIDHLNILLGLLVSGLIIGLWFYSKETRRKLNIGLIWILFFSLSSLLSYEVPQRMAFFEHRGYMVLIGFFIFISQLKFMNEAKRMRYVISVLIFLIFIFSAVSFVYSESYKNGMNFWTKAVKDTPELARTHKGLGYEYYNKGLYVESERELKKAIEIYPQEPRAHKFLGNLYYDQNRDEEALDAYFTELKINREEQLLIYKVAWLYARNGNFIDAEKYFLLMLELYKDHIPSHQDLVVLYFERGDLEKSKYHLQELVKRKAEFNSEVKRINNIYESDQ